MFLNKGTMIQLKLIRARKGVSLRDLARNSSVAVSILARLESGYADPRLSTLRRIAACLEVSIAELIGSEQPDRGTLSNRKGSSNMKRRSDKDEEVLGKLRDGSREAKKALDEWRKKYLIQGMAPYMWGYELQEIELVVKLLQLQLRNMHTQPSRQALMIRLRQSKTRR